jgi:uncharacterized membrane protein
MKSKILWNYKRITAYLFLTFFLYLMIVIIIPYISLNTDVGFLRIKQQYLNNKFWLISFFLHAFFAVISLLAGFTQFSQNFRIKLPKYHRGLGYLYAVNILIIGAPTGFVLGLFANGHLPSRIGFCLLAMLWFYFTLQAVRFARKKNFTRHRKFMIRSYALTLSAITLRIWKFALANTLAPNPIDLYQLVVWLGFVPNILIAELIIYYLFRKNESMVTETTT